MPTPRIRLCADDTYVELGPSVNNPFYILEGRRGHTRKDLHDALDRAIDALERTCPGYIAAAPQGRPARGTARNPKWRHFPALYRFWHEHPTDWIPEQFRDRQVAWERFALRLLQGRRPLAWEEFAGNVLEVRSGDTAHRYWVDAYPDDWDRNTSYSTVERDTKAAIEWLAPEPAVPAIPEAQCGPLSH